MCKCKYDMLQMTKFMCHKLLGNRDRIYVYTIPVGKGDNSKKKHFLLFKQCCQKAYFPEGLKSRGFVEKSEGLICLLYMTPF